MRQKISSCWTSRGPLQISETKVDGVRIAVEKELVAEVGPHGLSSFFVTTFVLAVHLTNWAPDVIWIGLAVFYGGVGQFVAGMWEFKRGNVFVATSYSSYGCYWMAVAMLMLLDKLGLAPAGFETMKALGWFLTAFLVFNTYMTFLTLLLSKVAFVTFFLLELFFLFLVIGCFRNHAPGHGWTAASGYALLLTSLAALYMAAASMFNTLANRTVLWGGSPLLKLSKGN
ncbi:unnamed protein product [Closterium sp. Yama58-4]|nr:unnamed protein product [Closterium sp. Yama58-4]